jgi:uncharacterized protein YbjT (DUF2867 family)
VRPHRHASFVNSVAPGFVPDHGDNAMSDGHRSALILGATGAVGTCCLRELLQSGRYQRVVAMGRRSGGVSHAKLVEIVTPLEQLATLDPAALGTIDDVFICLGTTQATAGSAAEFRRVELAFPRDGARLAKAHGAKHVLMVSAIAADARAPNLYLKVKGEVEAAVIAAGLETTSIFRPSLLLAERAEFRWKEKLSEPALRLLGLFMLGPARRLRPIRADAVARAMVRIAATSAPGVTVYPSDRIADIAAA